MILYPFLILLLIGAVYIVGVMLLRNSQELIILWGQSYTIEMSSFTLVVGLLLVFIVGYLLIAGMITLLLMPRNIARRREEKRIAMAHNDLKNGLVNLVEGHWESAETLLMAQVAHSETPLLNYLGAARASHMNQHYHQRDEYLKLASAYGEEAEIAVAVSQASMQFESGQIEQARATLTHLRELSPSHPYPNHLLMKVYLQQEDWKQLIQLVSVLSEQAPEEACQYQLYLKRAVVGLLEITSGKQNLKALNKVWQQLPDFVQGQTYALEAYSTALNHIGGGDLAAPLLEKAIRNEIQPELVACYGQIQHRHPVEALDKAMTWQVAGREDPILMLCLARLANQAGEPTKSAALYEQALSLVPDTRVYCEFAELLMDMGDQKNANRCYRQGLNYSVQGRASPFKRVA